MNEEKGIVLYSSEYDFEDDKGKQIKGVNFQYILTETMESLDNQNGFKGYQIAKGTLPFNKSEKFIEVPGLYKIIFGMSVNSKGRTELKALDVDFLSSVAVVT